MQNFPFCAANRLLHSARKLSGGHSTLTANGSSSSQSIEIHVKDSLEQFGQEKENGRVTVHQAILKTMSPPHPKKLGMETAVALAGTAFSAILLALTAVHAGPLWRDEVNTLNVAQMPSLKDLWDNMSCESFPPLWPLLLRGCWFLGLADSDANIRILGISVGFLFLASLWLCSRWIGGRTPIMSVALLGSLPAFIFIVGANRAYGLASCLLVLSFGTIWRMVEIPSGQRIFFAGLACFLFAHCVYYDVVFLCAMLSGAAIVVIRRRQLKTLTALAGIGFVSAGSMAIYLPIIHRGSAYVPMMQVPFFNLSTLWDKLCDALTARSSALTEYGGPEIWLWIFLLAGGSIVAIAMQMAKARQSLKQDTDAVKVRVRADLALFCAVSMIVGVLGYFVFLYRLHYWTQAWYYVEMFCLCAISLDGLLGANWPKLRPWGLLRVGFMVVMMTWCARPAWEEAHTRRSNVDLIAAVLNKSTSERDLIVVQSAWEGITFDRYYHGRARWVTVPPVDSHKVHRNDLIIEKINQPDPMAPVLRDIANTLNSSNSVWLVGNISSRRPVNPPTPGPPIKWYGSYIDYWGGQVAVLLQNHALNEQILEIPAGQPVSHLENLPLSRFSGYKSDAEIH
jgi:hypothetical protein